MCTPNTVLESNCSPQSHFTSKPLSAPSARPRSFVSRLRHDPKKIFHPTLSSIPPAHLPALDTVLHAHSPMFWALSALVATQTLALAPRGRPHTRGPLTVAPLPPAQPPAPVGRSPPSQGRTPPARPQHSHFLRSGPRLDRRGRRRSRPSRPARGLPRAGSVAEGEPGGRLGVPGGGGAAEGTAGAGARGRGRALPPRPRAVSPFGSWGRCGPADPYVPRPPAPPRTRRPCL